MKSFVRKCGILVLSLWGLFGGSKAQAQIQTLFVSTGTSIDEVTLGGTVSTFVSGLGDQPQGMAFDLSGNLFTGTFATGVINKITPGGSVSTFATGVNQTVGLAFDSSGNLYQSDYTTGGVNEISPAGVVSSFNSTTQVYGGLAFDSSGNLYVSNVGGIPFSIDVVKITPGGVASQFATGAGIGAPTGLVFDTSGNLYEADGTGVINMITPGGVVSTFATGVGTNPNGLVMDSSGNLYEGDNNTGSIFMITPGGVVSVLASVPGIVDLTIGDVPEPGSIALLVGGLGCLGLVVRRKRA